MQHYQRWIVFEGVMTCDAANKCNKGDNRWPTIFSTMGNLFIWTTTLLCIHFVSFDVNECFTLFQGGNHHVNFGCTPEALKVSTIYDKQYTIYDIQYDRTRKNSLDSIRSSSCNPIFALYGWYKIKPFF